MLSEEIFKKIQYIQLKAGRVVTDALAGEYSSIFKGVGMEFDKVREYQEGDDVRAIDWNVTARMNNPYVKVYSEERELTLMLMIDVSASLGFGTTGRFKNELAAELGAILAFLATKNNDKVGLIIFSDHVEQYIPPQKGRAHIWRLIRTVLTHESQGQGGTKISSTLDYFIKVCRRKSMCFLLSDFRADNFEKSLKMANKRHEVICVDISDQREKSIQSCGYIECIDSETGEHVVIDTSDKKFRQAYARERLKEKENLHTLFLKNKIDFFSLSTSESVINPFVRYMRQRERRLR